MLKVLIVDDEIMIRRGMKEIVDWRRLGCEVVATAADGEEGLEKIRQLSPELVLTDIKMPFKSGLEMIADCMELEQVPCFIVLTGFDEFEYVRQALRFHVTDYLLKPVDQAALTELITKVQNEINERKEHDAYLLQVEGKLEEGKQLLREKFVTDLMKGRLPAERLNEDLYAHYGVSPINDSYCIMIFEPGHLEGEDEWTAQMMRINMMEMIKEAMAEQFIHTLISEQGDVLVALVYAEVQRLKQWRAAAEEIQRRYEQNYSTAIKVSVSPVASGLDQAPRLFREAKEVIGYQMYEGSGTIIDFGQHPNTHSGNAVIYQIAQFLEKNYNENITLDRIAKQYFIDPSYFCKMFKNTIGETYLTYLTRIRMNKACELLQNPDVRVYEAARRVGYDNQRYFSQIFRKFTGYSPSNYQDKFTKK